VKQVNRLPHVPRLKEKEVDGTRFGSWQAELYLRDIKITMGMDILSCKTPEMMEKELWMHIIAYNLVRTLMQSDSQREIIRAGMRK